MVKRRLARRELASQRPSIASTALSNGGVDSSGGRMTQQPNRQILSDDDNKEDTDAQPWQKSRAKDICRELLLDPDSYVHGMPATHIYYTNDLFKKYKKNRFATNYNNLKKKIESERRAILSDQIAFDADKTVFPRNSRTNKGVLFWDVHPSRKILIDQLKNNELIDKTPKQVQAGSNGIYKHWPEKMFANFFYREKRRLKENIFWQAKRNRDGRKAHEREMELQEEPLA